MGQIGNPKTQLGTNASNVAEYSERRIIPSIADVEDPNGMQTTLDTMNARLRDVNLTLQRMNRFPASKMFKFNAAGYSTAPITGYPNQSLLESMTLNGIHIRSVYVENGTNQTQSIYEGAAGQGGISLTDVSGGTWRIITINDNVAVVSCFVAVGTGILRVVVSEEVWTPNMGNLI